MSIKQKINIDFDWALLTILAEGNVESCENIGNVNINTVMFSSTNDNSIITDNYNLKIDFENIPLSDELNDFSPIQFLESDEYVNVYFLEETNYTLIFEFRSDQTEFDTDGLFTELIDHKPEYYSYDEIKNNLFVININFRGHVGRTFIDLYHGDIKFNLPIEVRSRKINYERDYPVMIGDLAKFSSALMFDINASLFHNYEVHDEKRETKYEDYMMLEYIFKQENLPSVFEYLSKNLYSNIRTMTEEVPINFAYNINDNELINIVANPKNIVKVDDENYIFKINEKKYSPIYINESRHIDNIDVPENRFYKYFLEYLKYIIVKLKNDDDIVDYIKSRLESFENKVNYFLSQDYFSEITKMYYLPLNSQVLQKKEGYRDILEYFMMLDAAFKVNCDIISNEIKGFEKPLSKIYEIWCYFKLYDLIDDLSISSNNFNRFIGHDWNLNLETGFIDEFTYLLENGETVMMSLAYNQGFLGPDPTDSPSEERCKSYSLDMFPDFTISIEYNEDIYFVHFDAKYKVNRGEVKSEDIHKMHAYKDSIEGSIGSFVLFPGDLNSKIIYDKFGDTLSLVGAFPLNPLNNEGSKEDIKNLLISIINELVEN